MAELALVLPVMLILVLAIGDFGRVFAVSILLESAARNGAELAAMEYLADYPGKDASPPTPLSAPAPAGSSAYYVPLHARVARAVCDETQELSGSNYNAGTGTCAGMPLIQVCIHDSQDTECGREAMGATVPTRCGSLQTGPSNAHGGSGTARWAEVRICYLFRPLMSLPILPFGDIWLERTRTFTIPCYFALGTADECG